jgi:DNA-binding CsgD family transcriptional regulator
MPKGTVARVSRARLAALRADPANSLERIAAILGVHRNTVYLMCRDLGIPTPDRRVVDHGKLAAMWQAGIGSKEIAAVLGCHDAYVRVAARRMGLPKRGSGRPRETLDHLAQKDLARRMAAEAEATRQALRLSEMVDAKAGNWKAA